MTRVKICGLTRPEDAALAARLGAWALGVIFAPGSPRQVTMERAAQVLAAGRAAAAEARPGGGPQPDVERVGVFVNASAGKIVEAVRACEITAVQLHGEETPEECIEVSRRTGVKVIKALRVSGADAVASVVRFDTDLVLLDTYHPVLKGGTGQTFDWKLAAALPESLRAGRLILSGGLTPGNVVEAVRSVAPFAVDVSSGVESEPGVKEIEKMRSLFEAVTEMESS